MRALLAAALTAALAGAASAAPLFSDNFNTANGGTPAVPWNGNPNWNVSGGTVDLIGSGPGGTAFNFLPGNGLYVDLVGTGTPPGQLSTTQTFGPGTYQVTFSLAGSNTSSTAPETVTVSLGNWSTTIAGIPFNQPFTTYTFLATTTTTGSLSFQNSGPSDNIGALLDNVTVSTVPEPISLVLFGSLVVGGIVAVRRRMAKA